MSKTVTELCTEYGLDIPGLAEKARLDERRVLAIVESRWTPSPEERARIAKAFDLEPADIAWGHRTQVSHVYGHGPQFGRSP
ncbi:MAG: hypothetical protein L0Y72_23235 [Gemmataceae bacterium]|nr:hypothetical protein [Gemmataceae bacterium]MCI0741958.1 hypothetical protein [Gemmataceae bacterium]